MKVVVINGNNRHGSTWHCKEMILQQLSKYNNYEVTEFTLPKDMPHFCTGCFSCFYNGEHTCPHSTYISPIVSAMEESDLIILTSPVYALDVSGQLKALLDHLCFMWFSHRPNPKMFNKVALTITTTAGSGLSHTTKTLRNSLNFWGIKRIYSYKNAVSAMKWNEVKPEKQHRIEKDMKKLSGKIAASVDNIERLASPLYRKFLFTIMSGMMKKNTWNPYDKKHWESFGWLDRVRPF